MIQDPTPSDPWRLLSQDDRRRLLPQVAEWLKQPIPQHSRDVIAALTCLAVDGLVVAAHPLAYERYKPATSTDGRRPGARHERDMDEAETAAADDARCVRRELCTLLQERSDAGKAMAGMIGGIIDRWGQNQRQGTSDGPMALAERCTHQLAAALLFRCLPPLLQGEGPPNARDWIMWEVVLRVTVERVLLPRAATLLRDPTQITMPRLASALRGDQREPWRHRLREGLSSHIEECIQTVHNSALKFHYESMGKAVQFFAQGGRKTPGTLTGAALRQRSSRNQLQLRAFHSDPQ